jgi:hypothetical protein
MGKIRITVLGFEYLFIFLNAFHIVYHFLHQNKYCISLIYTLSLISIYPFLNHYFIWPEDVK